MRYVVTGGAGFIGSHLVEALVRARHEVVVLDDLSTGKREHLAPFLERITFVEGSVTDAACCARAIAGADYVLHQAAMPSVPRSVVEPLRSHEVNATGTLHVLLAARDAGVKRVVYAASSSAYGDTPELPKHEGMLPRPRSPYAASKLAGEEYCRACHASYGLPTVALRYFNVFGPRQDPASAYAAVVPRFIVAALSGGAPVIYGDGEQTRDFTYVENVVRANLLACEAPAAAFGEVFNIGCGERLSVNALWERVRALTGASATARHEPARAGDVRDSLASVALARATLGWSPTIGLEEGLTRTIAAHRASHGG
jgi:UDP-N-acetylglucosamine/UDP-N-acetylgalactosamine 4-epimerase